MDQRRFLTMTLAITMLVSAVSLLAQKGGKPKPPSDMPATATFRCAGLAVTCGNEYIPDAITGDGATYPALLRSDGELVVDINSGGGRLIYLNFAHQAAPPSGTFFRKTFTTATLDAISINTNIINPATGDVASDGARSIPIGLTWPSRIKGNWLDPYSVLYTIRFNPDGYPGSTYVDVTRLSQNSWTIEATEAHLARLVSPDGPDAGKRVPTDEGTYWMPFKITITVP